MYRTALVFLMSAWPVSADTTSITYDVGLIMALATPCGITLNDDAIAAYLAERIPAEDMGWSAFMSTQIRYHAGEFKKKSDLEKRLACEGAVRSVAHFGFGKP